MGTNYILPFASSQGATVYTDAEYLNSSVRPVGVSQGIADESLYNKAARNVSLPVAALSQFIVDYSSQDVSDSQTIPTIETNLIAALMKLLAGTLSPAESSNGQYRGHFVSPSGLIIQWGNDTTQHTTTGQGGGDQNTFNFSVQFPNRCFGVHAQEANANGWNVSASPGGPAATLYGIGGVNQTGFSLSCAAFTVASNGTVSLRYDGDAGFFFIAFGY